MLKITFNYIIFAKFQDSHYFVKLIFMTILTSQLSIFISACIDILKETQIET